MLVESTVPVRAGPLCLIDPGEELLAISVPAEKWVGFSGQEEGRDVQNWEKGGTKGRSGLGGAGTATEAASKSFSHS